MNRRGIKKTNRDQNKTNKDQKKQNEKGRKEGAAIKEGRKEGTQVVGAVEAHQAHHATCR